MRVLLVDGVGSVLCTLVAVWACLQHFVGVLGGELNHFPSILSQPVLFNQGSTFTM